MKTIYKSIKTASVLLGLATATSVSAQTYCIPSVASTADDEIGMVSFATMTNITTCGQLGTGPSSSAYLYSNWTGGLVAPNVAGTIAAPSVTIGSTYQCSVGLSMCNGGTYSGTIRVFIDYNQDGDFFDANESVWASGYVPGTLSSNVPPYITYSVPGGVTIPFSALTGLTRMRVWESEVSNPSAGPCDAITWGEVEDYVINIAPPPPCFSSPAPNSIVGPTFAICPNASTQLTLANSYTLGNITYSWTQSTLSNLGPWTPVAATSTQAALATPQLTTSTWFQLTATCTGFGAPTVVSAFQVSVQPITTSTVPYFEGFEGIPNTNSLPNCSWIMQGSTAGTYTIAQSGNGIPHTGSKYASFYYSPAATDYLYTNGIYLNAGVTYSAAIWYTTDYYSYINWALSLNVGPNQSAVNSTVIATANPAASPAYKTLSNTFTVATTGLYYVGIKVVSSGICCANRLSIDDISITIPCSLNTPSIAVSASSSSVCLGGNISLTGTGATSYTWNTGSNNSVITDAPAVVGTVPYTVVGTNSLTGCSATVIKNITVRPTPAVSIVPSNTAVCNGSFVNLTAIGSGATSYTWDSGANTSFVSVNPSQNTTYTVLGSNNFGCTAMATQMIMVNSTPTITALTSTAASCAGSNVMLTANGGTTYQWMANTAYIQGNPVIVTPGVSTTYTVTGTDDNGCTSSTTVDQVVYVCTGINERSTALAGLSVYPNPNNGEFVVELSNGLSKSVEVSDVTGRVLLLQVTSDDKVNVNINNYSKGVYYVKVKTNNAVDVIKIVKQ